MEYNATVCDDAWFTTTIDMKSPLCLCCRRYIFWAVLYVCFFLSSFVPLVAVFYLLFYVLHKGKSFSVYEDREIQRVWNAFVLYNLLRDCYHFFFRDSTM